MPILGVLEEIQTWGMSANCYAYAFKCPTPLNGNQGGAMPGAAGAAAGRAVAAGATWIDKVLADGGGAVVQCNETPDNPPPVHPGTYIVALIGHVGGFHFLRRDDQGTGRWSWKDGNMGSVKYNVLDTATSQFVYINSTNLNDLLVTRRAGFNPWAYANMNFMAFFRVPNGGMNVRR